MDGTTFDVSAAVTRAVEALDQRERDVVARAAEEAKEAAGLALEYAEHLAAGGKPYELPGPKPKEGEPKWSVRSRSWLVPYKMGLGVVYADWNERRGTQANPYSPVEGTKNFRIAEYALARIGEPLPYSALSGLGGGLARVPSDDIANVLGEVQDTNGRDLVVRRMKVDGKVAFLLRPRAEGEEYVGRRDEGRERRRVGGAASIPTEKKAKAGAS